MRPAACAPALLLALIVPLLAPPPARAQEAPDASKAGPTPGTATAEAKPAGPVVMTLGFCVFTVRGVDLKEQSFFADFYLWARYRANEERGKELERFEFMNGKLDTREEQDRKKVGDETYVCWRMSGTFHFVARLQAYPFDTQSLDLVIENSTLETDAVVFQDDETSYRRSGLEPSLWGVKADLDIPEFTIADTARTVCDSVYHTDFGDLARPQQSSRYSRFVFSMRFARDFMPYIYKILIPLMVIIFMAYLVFYLPAKEIQSASAMGISALLSAITFNISISQNLPEVGYLVVSDKFFICTYLVLLLTIVQSVATYVWDDQGEDERAARWLFRCRFVFPCLYVVGLAYLLVQAVKRGAA